MRTTTKTAIAARVVMFCGVHKRCTPSMSWIGSTPSFLNEGNSSLDVLPSVPDSISCYCRESVNV